MVTNVPSDKYDKAVEWLTEHPGVINTTWSWAVSDGQDLSPEQEEAHKIAACLFQNCGAEDGEFEATGCLTQVAHHSWTEAGTPELTEAIRADKDNIPAGGEYIEVKDLPVFAKWRRRIDRELAEAKA